MNVRSWMKPLIYISGILGGLLLAIRLVGIIAVFPQNDLFLGLGLVLLGLVCLPLFVIDRHQHREKMKRIIYGDGQKRERKKVEVPHANKKGSNGWDMNNSPFRQRNSGLSWGGGNVHAANAKRNKRRGFLK